MCDSSTLLPASFMKRLWAIIYDLMLVLPVLMLATAVWLPFNGGNAIEPSHLLYPYMRLTQLLAVACFYLYFWLKGGQTLGMRAWRLYVQQQNGQKITLSQGITRLISALPSFLCLGMGFLWILISPSGSAWHDTLSKTEVVYKPKKMP